VAASAMEHAAVICRDLDNQNEGWITRSTEFDFSGKLGNIDQSKILKYRTANEALGIPGDGGLFTQGRLNEPKATPVGE